MKRKLAVWALRLWYPAGIVGALLYGIGLKGALVLLGFLAAMCVIAGLFTYGLMVADRLNKPEGKDDETSTLGSSTL